MSPAESDVDPAGTRVAFDHQRLGARFPAASAAHRPAAPAPMINTGTCASRLTPETGLTAAHDRASSCIASSMVAILRPAAGLRWRRDAHLVEKAAQPSSSTMTSKSRTWASRTVDATPPLVTMPAQYKRLDAGLAQHPFQPPHVERRIGDLLDREIGRLQLIDQRLAPGARREIALGQERPQRLEMRRDERLAALARHQRELGRDDQAAALRSGSSERLEAGRQRRDLRRRSPGAAIGAVRVQEIVLQIDAAAARMMSASIMRDPLQRSGCRDDRPGRAGRDR